jgi:hypothetical protein
MLSLAAFALLLAAAAPSALAAEYEVEVCTLNAQGGNGIELFEPSAAPLFFESCGVNGPVIRQGMRAGVLPELATQRWKLVSPPGTKIKTLEAERSFTLMSQSFIWWVLFNGDGTLLDEQLASRPIQPAGRKTYPVNSRVVEGQLFCPSYANHTCPGGEFDIDLKNVVAKVDDEAPPGVPSPTLPSGTVRGTVQVGYSAFDIGSGLANLTVSVDGVVQQGIHDDNGGKCPRQPPYQYLAPCVPSVESSLALDMTSLAEGRHRLEVSAEDAAGQRTDADPVEFTVHNAPTPTARPAIAGTATVGEQLSSETGRWEGDPTDFGFEWLRCPAATRADGGTAGCTPIPGAIGQSYTAQAADRGSRDLVRVTASNYAGSGSVIGTPTDIIAAQASRKPPPPSHKPPVVSHLTLTQKRFKVATGRSPQQEGSVLRFSSSKPGQLSLAIAQLGKGRKRPYGKLAAKIKAGRSAVLLTGEIGARTLPAGRYLVTIRVRDSKGYSSKPQSVPFTILPG